MRSLQQFDYIELADLLGVGIPREDARRLLDAVKETFHVSCRVDSMQTVCLNLGQSSFLDAIASQEPALSLSQSLTHSVSQSVANTEFSFISNLQTADSRQQTADSRQ